MGRSWTSKEDQILKTAVTIHGTKNWKKISMFSGINRCHKSCRERWINHLNPDLNKKGEKFSEIEEHHVVQLLKKHRASWTKIAGHFPGRSALDIKNHWYNRLRKKFPQLDHDLKMDQATSTRPRTLLEQLGHNLKENPHNAQLLLTRQLQHTLQLVQQQITNHTIPSGSGTMLVSSGGDQSESSSTHRLQHHGLNLGSTGFHDDRFDPQVINLNNHLPYAGFNTNSSIGNYSSCDAGTETSVLSAESVVNPWLQNEASSSTSFMSTAYAFQKLGRGTESNPQFPQDLLQFYGVYSATTENDHIFDRGNMVVTSSRGCTTGGSVAENDLITGLHGSDSQMHTYLAADDHGYHPEILNWQCTPFGTQPENLRKVGNINPTTTSTSFFDNDGYYGSTNSTDMITCTSSMNYSVGTDHSQGPDYY